MIDNCLRSTKLSQVGEDIGLLEGKKLVEEFRQAYPDATAGYYIGRDILDRILAQPGCVGINFRKCISGTKEHLVYTAVNEEGKDILHYTVVSVAGLLEKQDAIVGDKTWWEDDASNIFWPTNS